MPLSSVVLRSALPTCLVIVLLPACATVPGAASQGEQPGVTAISRPTPPQLLPDVALDTTQPADFDAVPALQAPSVVWGPIPAGTVHSPHPRTYDLQHQAITVRFDWARHAVIGSTTLRVTPLDTGIRTIALDAVGMTIKQVTANSGGTVTHTYDDTVLQVTFSQPLPTTVPTSVTIDYETVQPKKGAYFIDRVHYLWTQGETDDNRYWVPTYDHPDDKTTWEIRVTTDTGERALSNGRLIDSARVADGVQWHWSQDKPASTYLMSVVTGKYAVIGDHWRDIPVHYWVYPDTVALGRIGFRETPRAIELFSQKTGVPYPWAKYDQSVVPDFIFGGMENVTATTQNDKVILHPMWAEPQVSSTDLVAHELAHQWFGDLLTARDWPHIWLNEGFATFMADFYDEATRGADEGALSRDGSRRSALNADVHARRPIVFDRWQRDPIELFFSGHIYPKGATVLQMLRHRFGDRVFWQAMHRYITTHAYQNVVTDDLKRAFEETTKQDLTPFFNQWVYGAGYPVFQVSSSYDTATRRLTLHATQVQPRDSLTGYFDADVDVEALTARGTVRGVMPVRNGTGEITLALSAAPRAMRWNVGNWLLETHDFPRSARMLAYQLAHDDDVLGRAEAIAPLRERASQASIRPAILQAFIRAAMADKCWAVRRKALEAAAALGPDSATQQMLAGALVSDPDPRVREAVLTLFSGAVAPVRLAEVAQRDPSLFVRGVALAAYLTATGEAGLPLAERVMAQSSWRNALRAPALEVLSKMQGTAAQALYRKYAK